MSKWEDLVAKTKRVKSLKENDSIKVGIIGKYVNLHDAYKSMIEAISHAGVSLQTKTKLVWIDCRASEYTSFDSMNKIYETLDKCDCFIIPGGFGDTGVETIIKCIQYVREKCNKKPLLGICLGMQLICVEYARNVLKLENAGSSEMGKYYHEIVKIMRNDEQLGGTMRLGAHNIILEQNSASHILYKSNKITERHRHRYDVNPAYTEYFEKSKLKFIGRSEDGLVEIVELHDNIPRYYVGCQFHPEFKSTPMNPAPLFVGLIGATIKTTI